MERWRRLILAKQEVRISVSERKTWLMNCGQMERCKCFVETHGTRSEVKRGKETSVVVSIQTGWNDREEVVGRKQGQTTGLDVLFWGRGGD